MQSARNPQQQLVEAPNPIQAPRRRSARKSAVKTLALRANKDMPQGEEMGEEGYETKTSDEYIPGK